MEHMAEEHFDKFVISEIVHDPEEWAPAEKNLRRMFSATGQGEAAYTIFSKGNGVVAFFGGRMVSDTVADVWAIMSVNIDKYPIAITRLAKQLITHYHLKLGIRRFQMKVRMGQEKAAAWAVSLGFKYEGDMPAPDGRIYWIFGRNV